MEKMAELATKFQKTLIPVVLNMCKKLLFFKIEYRIRIYLSCLLFSIIADVISFPETYFSSSRNPVNDYFVKFAWAWNLVLIVPFVLMTAYTISCGKKSKILVHLLRIIVVTFFWWFWTSIFHNIDIGFGFCGDKTYNTRRECKINGFRWYSVDISGHTFILIFGSLFIIEETYCMLNWPFLKHYIKRENDNASGDESKSFKSLTSEDTAVLKWSYEKFTPYVTGLFIGLTGLQFLWDMMLMITILYYHVSYEKIIGGGLAVLSWYFIYRICDKYLKSSSYLPGLVSIYKLSTKKPLLGRKSIKEQTNIIPDSLALFIYSCYVKIRSRHHNN